MRSRTRGVLQRPHEAAGRSQPPGRGDRRDDAFEASKGRDLERGIAQRRSLAVPAEASHPEGSSMLCTSSLPRGLVLTPSWRSILETFDRLVEREGLRVVVPPDPPGLIKARCNGPCGSKRLCDTRIEKPSCRQFDSGPCMSSNSRERRTPARAGATMPACRRHWRVVRNSNAYPHAGRTAPGSKCGHGPSDGSLRGVWLFDEGEGDEVARDVAESGRALPETDDVWIPPPWPQDDGPVQHKVARKVEEFEQAPAPDPSSKFRSRCPPSTRRFSGGGGRRLRR